MYRDHRFLKPMAVLGIALMLIAGCAGSTGKWPREGFQLTVLHTNDTWGYLFPCG